MTWVLIITVLLANGERRALGEGRFTEELPCKLAAASVKVAAGTMCTDGNKSMCGTEAVCEARK
jgi:hypothetical protein